MRFDLHRFEVVAAQAGAAVKASTDNAAAIASVSDALDDGTGKKIKPKDIQAALDDLTKRVDALEKKGAKA